MRKIFLTGLLLSFAFTLMAAETVSTISFNPSRLGQYTYLKINKEINLKGGLQVSDQTHLNSPANDVGELVFTAGNGGSINITGASDIAFEIPNLTTKSGANAGVNINMPTAEFIRSSTAPVGTVEMYGGAMNMSNSTAASTITTLTNASGTMVIKATNDLQSNGNISVTGGTGPSGYSGMTLGNIRVPKPTTTFERYCWKNLQGVDGKLKVFALCTAAEISSGDYAVVPAEHISSWGQTENSAANLTFNSTATHTQATVSAWSVNINSASKSGTGNTNMWLGHGDAMSTLLQGAVDDAAATTVCASVFSGASTVVSSAPSGTCTTHGAKKVHGQKITGPRRCSIICNLYTCQ